MSEIQIILFRQAGKIHYQGDIIDVDGDQLVITTDEASVSMADRKSWLNLFCYPGELHALYHEVMDLLGPNDDSQALNIAPIKVIPVFSELGNIIEQFNGNRLLLMKFIFIYCLSMDKHYFSGLLRYFLAHNNKVINYLEAHFMQPWSVATFAANLGVEVRKLNCLFYKNYGVSAKQWLLEQRLIYARQQLITTDKKITDIALDSGFSHHSHFTDAFKKRYLCCPTTMRSAVA